MKSMILKTTIVVEAEMHLYRDTLGLDDLQFRVISRCAIDH